MNQSMSYAAVSSKVKKAAQEYGKQIQAGTLTLDVCQDMVSQPDKYSLDLFQIAGLAMATACFQCSAE